MKILSAPRIRSWLLASFCALGTAAAPAVAAAHSFGGGGFHGGFGGGFGGGRFEAPGGFGDRGRFAGRPGGFGPRAFGFSGDRGFGRAPDFARHDIPFGPRARVFASPVGRGPWIGPRVGGGAWGWRDAAIAEGALWAGAWGLGAGFAYFAPPVVYVPAPLYVALPPVVVSVPWLDATAPAEVLPPVVPAVAAAPAPNYFPTPEAMLWAALPPPVVVMPPAEVMIAAAPPPVIFAPPVEALSVWPALAFAPPLLAVAVLHADWWSGSYHGLGGYHVGARYAERGFGIGRPLLAAAELSRHDGPGLLRDPGMARAGFGRSPGDFGRLGAPAVAFAHAEGGPRLGFRGGAGGFGHEGGGGFHGGFGGGRGR